MQQYHVSVSGLPGTRKFRGLRDVGLRALADLGRVGAKVAGRPVYIKRKYENQFQSTSHWRITHINKQITSFRPPPSAHLTACPSFSGAPAHLSSCVSPLYTRKVGSAWNRLACPRDEKSTDVTACCADEPGVIEPGWGHCCVQKPLAPEELEGAPDESEIRPTSVGHTAAPQRELLSELLRFGAQLRREFRVWYTATEGAKTSFALGLRVGRSV